MEEKRRISLLVGIMVVVLSAVGALSLTMLYRAAIQEQKERLSEIARSMALHYAEAAEIEGFVIDGRLKEVDDETLHRLVEAHTHYVTRTESGEVVVARREGDTMIFIMRRKWHEEEAPAILPFGSRLAEPMRRALSGFSGTMIGPDYRGETVLAAYEPVPALGLGVVTKIDLAEIRAPFVRAGAVAGGAALVLAIAASIAFLRISAPMIRHIAESEERLRRAYDAAKVGAWEWDLDTNRNTWSDEIWALYGLKLRTGKPSYDLWVKSIHPDDRSQAEAAAQTAAENGEELNAEWRVNDPGGPERWLMSQGKPQRDENGRVTCYLGIVMDITERKRGEEALRASEERYRTTLEGMIEGCQIVGPDWRYLYMNEAACRHGRRPKSELLGKTMMEAYPGIDETPMFAILRECMENRQSSQMENEFAYPDGTTGTFFLSFEPVPEGMFILSLDISLRKRAERDLKESERKYRAMIMNLSEGFYATTLDGLLLDHNPEFNRVLGFDPEQNLVGARLPDFWQDPNERAAYVKQLRKHGVVRNYLIRAKKQNGEKIFVEASARIVHDQSGTSERIEGSFIDVTDRRRAEEALLLLSSRQEAILDAVTDIIVEVDTNKTYTWSNQAGYDFFGNDVIGKEAAYYFEGEQETYSIVKPLFNGNDDIFYVESWQRRRDGESRLLAWWCRALKDSKGNTTGALSSARDITDRRAAEQEVKKSAAFLDSIIEQSPVAAWISDAHGNLLRTNKSLCDLLHITPEEVVGKYNVFEDNIVQKQGLIPTIRAVFEKGETARFVIRYDTTELNILELKDSATVYLDITAFPIRDPAGEITNVVFQEQDITEKRRAEETILIQNKISNIFLTVTDQEMYNNVLNVILDVMDSKYGVFGYIDDIGALVVPTMTRQVWDQCEVAEKNIVFPRDTWGHSSWPRAIREKKANYSNKPSRNMPAGHVAISRHITLPILFRGDVIGLFQIANKESDYNESDLHTLSAIAEQIAPILDARLHHEKAEYSLRKLNEDLEQRIRDRTAQLEAINKELESFSYSVSHDLRAPLRAVDGFTRVLVEDYDTVLDDEGRRLARVIRDNAQRMGKLIDDLLEFSRVGRGELHVSSVNMELAAQSVFVEVTTEEERKRINYTVKKLPTAQGDPAMLRQVWTNLISNAVKFSSRKDRAVIKVSGEEKPDSVVYRITDNGAGFDMKYADKLFGVFQRLHGEREFPGTGVGLAIVQRVILRHGGSVWAESEVDKGATFTFSLPKNGGAS